MAEATPHAAAERFTLADPALLQSRAYVAGRWVAAADGQVFAVANPADGATLGTVASLSDAESAAAVDAAHTAFAGWAAALPQERARLLRRWHELLLAAREDLARIMTLEQGKPLAEARGEIDYAASFVEFYAEEARRPNIEGDLASARCRGGAVARAGRRGGAHYALEPAP